MNRRNVDFSVHVEDVLITVIQRIMAIVVKMQGVTTRLCKYGRRRFFLEKVYDRRDGVIYAGRVQHPKALDIGL
jgi:hypothetical protein